MYQSISAVNYGYTVTFGRYICCPEHTLQILKYAGIDARLGALGDAIDAMVSHSRCEAQNPVWDDHKEARRSWPRAAARVRLRPQEESRTARIWSVSVVVNGL
jgi:hypothetical protein